MLCKVWGYRPVLGSRTAPTQVALEATTVHAARLAILPSLTMI